MNYIYDCTICNERFELTQKMNDKHIAFHCGIQARRVFTSPQTNKDLMYQFDTTIFGPSKKGEAVNIYSRRQYKKLLKKNGLVDSTPRECLTVKPKTEADHKVRIHKFAEKTAKDIYKKGAMDFVTAPLKGR